MSDFFLSLSLLFFSRFDGKRHVSTTTTATIYQLNEIEMENDPLANFQSSSLMQSDKDVDG